MTTHTVAACPACGGTQSERVDLAHEHELRRCAACDLVHATVYADPSDIYVDGYLSGGTDFGLDIFHPRFQEFLAFAGHKRMELIESLTPRGSIVDVGCGSGEVLQAARQRGWTVAGAEPVEESAAIARERGLDVRTAILEESGLPQGEWDVVSAFHVLEHMSDGAAFLRSIMRWARPGGLLVIEVPNWASVDRINHGPGWSALRPLEHIAHYTPETMERILRSVGLEPVVVRTLGFLWDQQTLQEQLRDLGHERWGKLLEPISRKAEEDGRRVSRPGPLVRRALLAVQDAYDRRGKGQVVFAAARVPS